MLVTSLATSQYAVFFVNRSAFSVADVGLAAPKQKLVDSLKELGSASAHLQMRVDNVPTKQLTVAVDGVILQASALLADAKRNQSKGRQVLVLRSAAQDLSKTCVSGVTLLQKAAKRLKVLIPPNINAKLDALLQGDAVA